MAHGRSFQSNSSNFPPFYNFSQNQELVALEMRLKDKTEFIELFGDRDTIQIMKEFLPLLYEPIFEIYQQGDLPHVVDEFFGLIKK
jgi:hypothetical protein